MTPENNVRLLPSMRFSAGGIHFRVDGAGPVILFIHGVGLDHSMWDQVGSRLAEDYTILCPDLPGHGASAPAPPLADIDWHADQLADVLAELQLNQVTVVGFSLGALVARSMVERHRERVTGLALLHCVFCRDEEAQQTVMQRLQQAQKEGTGSLIDAALARWFSADFLRSHPGVEQSIRNRLTDNDPQQFMLAYRLFATADTSRVGKLTQGDIATLIMTGELDIGSTPEMSQALADHIPGAELVILPGQRHLAAIEAARPTSEHLRAWLRRVTGS